MNCNTIKPVTVILQQSAEACWTKTASKRYIKLINQRLTWNMRSNTSWWRRQWFGSWQFLRWLCHRFCEHKHTWYRTVTSFIRLVSGKTRNLELTADIAMNANNGRSIELQPITSSNIWWTAFVCEISRTTLCNICVLWPELEQFRIKEIGPTQ